MVLISLTSENFYVTPNNTGGRVLATNQQGVCVVLFYTQTCEYSRVFFPKFCGMANTMQDVTFCVVDLTNQQNSNIIPMSQSTSTPFKSVPIIILYVNGVPYAKYLD